MLSSGPARAGMRLRSLRDLTVTFQSEYRRVRSAIVALTERGILAKRQGSGTFIRRLAVTLASTLLLGESFQKIAAGQDGFRACDFQGTVSAETSLLEFINHGGDADHALTKRDGGHAAAEAFPALRFHFGGHVFPVNVADTGTEFAHERDGVAAAQPQVAGVKIEAEGFGMTGIKQALQQSDVVGDRAVWFEKERHTQVGGEPQGFLELLPDGKKLFVIRKTVTEGRGRFALCGDDVIDPNGCGGADGFDDLGSTVTPGCAGIQQICVGAPCGNLQPMRDELAFQVVRITVQAGQGSETKLDSQTCAVAVIGDIGVSEPPFGDLPQLDIERTERGIEGETAYFHKIGRTGLWVSGSGCVFAGDGIHRPFGQLAADRKVHAVAMQGGEVKAEVEFGS